MEVRFKSRPEAHDLVDRVGEAESQLTLDWSRVQFVKPAALVTVAAIAEAHRGGSQAPAKIVYPASREIQRYLSRMSLSQVLDEMGVSGAQLPSVHHHNRDDRLCELTRFEDSAVTERLIDLVQQRCQTAGFEFEVEDRLTQAIWELAENCLEHSQAGCGFLAAQVLPGTPREMHFAVADGGIGIRASLESTLDSFVSDRAAIEAAIQPRVTSVQHRARGVGLPNLLEWTTGIGGVLAIRSGDAAVVFDGRGPNLDAWPREYAVDSLVGTLVSGWLPC